MSLAAHEKRIFLSACEASADLHGGHLIEALSALLPGATFCGIGGDRMAAAGQQQSAHVRDLSSMGIGELFGRLGAYKKAYFGAKATFFEDTVDVAVVIDSPDFNLRLAAQAKRAGIPVVYFIGPKLWAWRKGRLKTIARVVDHMMVILPFEAPMYEQAGVPVTYVGNPLVDDAQAILDKAPSADGWQPSDFGLDNDRLLIALLPGSRPKEIQLLLPDLLGAAEQLYAQRPDVQFIMPLANSVDRGAIRMLVSACDAPICCVDDQAVEALAAADLTAVASGTATLQAALADTPGVIVYRVALTTYVIGSLLINVPHYGLVNLISSGLDSDERLVPECMQWQLNPASLCAEWLRLLDNPEVLARQRQGLQRVRDIMGGCGAPERAARVVASMGAHDCSPQPPAAVHDH